MMAIFAAAALSAALVGSAAAQPTMSEAPVICPPSSGEILRQTPECGVRHFGLFGIGRFITLHQIVGKNCVPREIFLGCVPGY